MSSPPTRAQVSALLDLQRFDEAAGAASVLLATDPADSDACCLLARAHLGAGRHFEAAQAAQRALELSPDSAHACRLLSAAYREQGRLPDAVQMAQESVRLTPNDWRCHVALAYSAATAHDYPLARDAGDRAVELAPWAAATHAASGYAAMTGKNNRAAEAALRKALELDPTHAEALNNLAVVQLRTKRLGTALRGFHHAVAADPRLHVARRNVDSVLSAVLWRAQWFIALVAGVNARFLFVFHDMPRRVSAGVVGGCLLLVVAASWWSLSRIPRQLRPYAWSYLRLHPALAWSAVLSLIGLSSFCAIAVTSGLLAAALALAGAVAAIAGARLNVRARKRMARG